MVDTVSEDVKRTVSIGPAIKELGPALSSRYAARLLRPQIPALAGQQAVNEVAGVVAEAQQHLPPPGSLIGCCHQAIDLEL